MLRLLILAVIANTFFFSRADATTVQGQWVWSRSDIVPFEKAAQVNPDLVTGIRVATLFWQAKTKDFRTKLGVAPRSVPSNQIIVVRLDDALHRAWKESNQQQVADKLSKALKQIKILVGGKPVQWQLDYDVGTAHIAKWAEVLRPLRSENGALVGERLWITSLISHVIDVSYDHEMFNVIDGHILQIFETGDELSTKLLDRTREFLAKGRIPFAVGIAPNLRPASFGSADAMADIQRQWLASLAKEKNFVGSWVFPAGKMWATR